MGPAVRFTGLSCSERSVDRRVGQGNAVDATPNGQLPRPGPSRHQPQLGGTHRAPLSSRFWLAPFLRAAGRPTPSPSGETAPCGAVRHAGGDRSVGVILIGEPPSGVVRSDAFPPPIVQPRAPDVNTQFGFHACSADHRARLPKRADPADRVLAGTPCEYGSRQMSIRCSRRDRRPVVQWLHTAPIGCAHGGARVTWDCTRASRA